MLVVSGSCFLPHFLWLVTLACVFKEYILGTEEVLQGVCYLVSVHMHSWVRNNSQKHCLCFFWGGDIKIKERHLGHWKEVASLIERVNCKRSQRAQHCVCLYIYPNYTSCHLDFNWIKVLTDCYIIGVLFLFLFFPWCCSSNSGSFLRDFWAFFVLF